MRTCWLILTALLGVLPEHVTANVSLHLPLAGEYLPGHYLPVRVVAELDATELRLSAPGIVPLHLALGPGGRLDRVVPVLVVGAVSSIWDWSTEQEAGTVSLPHPWVLKRQPIVGVVDSLQDHPLSGVLPEEGFTRFTRFVFRSVDPLPDPLIAWELLDAIVLDPSSLAGLGMDRIGQVLSCGIAIYVRQHSRPDEVWPWYQQGDFWVLKPVIEGPISALVRPEAYWPVMDWKPGPTDARRRLILGVALLVAMVMLGTLLTLKAWVSGVVALGLGTGLWIWASVDPPIRQAIGVIAVHDRRLVQIDTWRYFTAPRPARHEIKGEGLIKPLLLSSDGVVQLDLEMRQDASLSPLFSMAVARDVLVGFLDRMVLPAGPEPSMQPVGGPSPMLPLVRRMYQRPGDRVREVTDPMASNHWPTLIILRSKVD